MGSRACLCRSPIVTGATVLGIKYADGVMLVADTLGTCVRACLRGTRRLVSYTLALTRSLFHARAPPLRRRLVRQLGALH
ncbi:hypothetical protein EON67_03345 [archaeon]|nr:MAG: hypothetical protein EON67_03345 [archaeon]